MTARPPPGEDPDAIPAPDESTPEQPVVQHSGTPLVEPAEPAKPAEPAEPSEPTESTGPDPNPDDDDTPA